MEWELTKYKEQNFTLGNWKKNRYHPAAIYTIPLCHYGHNFLCNQWGYRLCCSWNGFGYRKQDKNGAIGVLKDLQTPVYSIATWAKDKGCRVGVATSVSVDHATPAAFYAHAAGRSSYYAIGTDLYKTGFDFMPVPIFCSQKIKTIHRPKIFTKWLTNTDIP